MEFPFAPKNKLKTRCAQLHQLPVQVRVHQGTGGCHRKRSKTSHHSDQQMHRSLNSLAFHVYQYYRSLLKWVHLLFAFKFTCSSLAAHVRVAFLALWMCPTLVRLLQFLIPSSTRSSNSLRTAPVHVHSS